MNPRQQENEILMRWALRFDGYLYREETKFDTSEFADRFFTTWTLTWAKPMDCLAAFFLWQRFLGKWGGETLPLNNRHWRLYRELFLCTAHLEVPPSYRREPWTAECYQIWEEECARKREEHLEIVRKVHARTRYSIEEPAPKPRRSRKRKPAESKHVELYHSSGDGSAISVWAQILENGDFQVAGQDTGKLVEKHFGSDHYEYWVTVAATEKDAVLLALLQAYSHNSNAPEIRLKELLTQKSIPFKFFCY